jgi:lysophospholipase L1-like esterase
VLVLSIPDWGVTPFAKGRDRQRISTEIDAFNRANQEEARSAGALYVDITPISRQKGAEPAFLAADGLHPSARMYAAWTDLLSPAVQLASNR